MARSRRESSVVTAASPASSRRSDASGSSADDPWGPARSRIVLRKPRRNRRVTAARLLPPAGEVLDACGRALRRCAPALVGLAMIAAFGGAAALSHRWVTTSTRFAIGAIDVRGTAQLAPAAVAELLPVHLGDNMFAADTRTLERALAAHPWIARAEVHRELPRTLVATITERTAAAVVDLGGLYLVDPSGRPFKRASLGGFAGEAGEANGLPVITGIERLAFRSDPVATSRLIRAGLAAIDQWGQQPSRPPVAEISFDVHRGLTLRTAAPAVAVFLGALDDPSLSDRMAMFDAAWQHLSADERARTETMYLDAGLGQATIAFAKN
jgi:POTRA domain, FtsQ-type/Cell division protein FtsQ